ncbi:NAD(+) diphosphatase [Taklimakanibacter lacteus]|uniref:NAD(+) diphosphatase n=1 Tax=Taklimakanibacter lacteus TaxID=2268456 RepID=UPI000E66BEBC
MPNDAGAVIRSPLLGFCGGSLDRAAAFRSDPGWIAARRAEPTARLVRLNGDKTRIVDSTLHLETPVDEAAIFLGLDPRGRAIFAGEIVEPAEGMQDLRSLAIEGHLAPEDLALLAQARSLLHWHQRHRYCANCGHETEMKDGGYRRHCVHCAADHFPRTDPVVIIVVRAGGQYLLGRQSSWPTGRYSALAGFLEPGETIEDAARREVREESGIRVGTISYVTSQPWPYPSSLMIGLIGEALNRDIVVDETELEDARWFSREEIVQMLDGRHPEALSTPPPMAIAHRILEAAVV